MTEKIRPHRSSARMLALGTACTLLLSACGGGSDASAPAPAPAPAPSPAPAPAPAPVGGTQKVLLLDVDGLSYEPLLQARLAGQQTGLEGMYLAPAWTGGQTATLTEQMSSGRPSWATLLTGQWAGHGIVWEKSPSGESQTLPASIFTPLAQSALPLRSAAVVDDAAYAQLLTADNAKPSSLLDCSAQAQAQEQARQCVLDSALQKINEGYDLTVAHLGVQNLGGEANAYALMAQLRAAVDARQKVHTEEKWLVLITSGARKDRFGSVNGTQSVADKTTFVASNQALASLNTRATAAPSTLDELYANASLADIAPTVLRYVQVAQAPALYTSMDGQALQSAVAIRQAQAQADKTQSSMELSWQFDAVPSEKLVLLRDGQEIVQLPSDTTSYVDDQLPATSTGEYHYRYTLITGDSGLSWPAKISYVKPIDLAPSILNGLRNYFSFNNSAQRDATGSAVLQPRSALADGGKALAADNFSGHWQGSAWRIDTNVVASDGTAGYGLTDPAGDITKAAQFTVGFWFRTEDLCGKSLSNGVPILSNKNWNSGGNAGITIGLWSGCEVRFNLGGNGRVDNTGNKVTAGQWVYMALAIDQAARTFTSYVFDPVAGRQKKSQSYKVELNSFLSGLGNGFTLAEDGTGKYIFNEKSSGSPRGTMDFNDLGVWTRALTDDELDSIYRSQKPVGSLLP